MSFSLEQVAASRAAAAVRDPSLESLVTGQLHQTLEAFKAHGFQVASQVIVETNASVSEPGLTSWAAVRPREGGLDFIVRATATVSGHPLHPGRSRLTLRAVLYEDWSISSPAPESLVRFPFASTEYSPSCAEGGPLGGHVAAALQQAIERMPFVWPHTAHVHFVELVEMELTRRAGVSCLQRRWRP